MKISVLSGEQPAEPGAKLQRVRFKDEQGNVLVEVQCAAAMIEVADPASDAFFRLDAAGNVEG